MQRGLFPPSQGRPPTLAEEMKPRPARRPIGDSLHIKFLPPASPAAPTEGPRSEGEESE